MAEDLTKKVEELEAKLEKARTLYQEQKAQIAELKKNADRVKELEDELVINGNAAEEVKALNARLDKAKEIFNEQKDKIKDLTEKLTKEQFAVEEANNKFLALEEESKFLKEENEGYKSQLDEIRKIVNL